MVTSRLCHDRHVAHYEASFTRRDFLCRSGAGFGAVALNWMLQQQVAATINQPQRTDHRPRAKSVIWLFMEGGPSHLDLVDPKPLLNNWQVSRCRTSFEEPITAMGKKVHHCWPLREPGNGTAKAGCGPPNGFPTSPSAWTTLPSFVHVGPTASIMPAASAR